MFNDLAHINELTNLINSTLVTTTIAISECTEVGHAIIIDLVRTHLSDLEVFGLINFEIQPSGDEYAILNEQQANLLLEILYDATQ